MRWRLPHSEADPRVVACYAVAACRFAGSAALAYFLASTLGPPRPIWATVSALVVSQETLDATRGSIKGRIGGTLLGATFALGTEWAGGRLGIPVTGRVAIMAGLAALIAQQRVPLRASLWTGVIILLTSDLGKQCWRRRCIGRRRSCFGALAGMVPPLIENLVTGALSKKASPRSRQVL